MFLVARGAKRSYTGTRSKDLRNRDSNTTTGLVLRLAQRRPNQPTGHPSELCAYRSVHELDHTMTASARVTLSETIVAITPRRAADSTAALTQSFARQTLARTDGPPRLSDDPVAQWSHFTTFGLMSTTDPTGRGGTGPAKDSASPPRARQGGQLASWWRDNPPTEVEQRPRGPGTRRNLMGHCANHRRLVAQIRMRSTSRVRSRLLPLQRPIPTGRERFSPTT